MWLHASVTRSGLSSTCPDVLRSALEPSLATQSTRDAQATWIDDCAPPDGRHRREIAVSAGRIHGWIDLLAFDPRSGALLIVEIKTRLDDLGAIERQIGWYERCALDVAFSLNWQSRTVSSWLLMLASEEVEDGLRRYRDVLRVAFPRRAVDLRQDLVQPDRLSAGHRGLALIDPTSHRRDWLMPSRSDGRRTAPPYRDYAEAAQRLG